ncbi:MAG: hypothetical protein IJK02_06405 [Clostridia bacterium]|nr:hypothetical protein [Clostridia bacterium]
MKRILSLGFALILLLALCSCGGNNSGNKADNSNNSRKTSSNEEIVLNPPVTVINNEIGTLTITRFFNKLYNEGTEYEYWWSGFEVDVTNNMDDYYLNVWLNNVSLSDQRVIEFSKSASSDKVSSGKTAVFEFGRSDYNKFEKLDALYELEGFFVLNVSDDSHSYSNMGGNTPFSIAESMNKSTQ